MQVRNYCSSSISCNKIVLTLIITLHMLLEYDIVIQLYSYHICLVLLLHLLGKSFPLWSTNLVLFVHVGEKTPIISQSCFYWFKAQMPFFLVNMHHVFILVLEMKCTPAVVTPIKEMHSHLPTTRTMEVLPSSKHVMLDDDKF